MQKVLNFLKETVICIIAVFLSVAAIMLQIFLLIPNLILVDE